MPHFSAASLAHLDNLHTKLQLILKKAIQIFDFTITDSTRAIEQQKKLVAMGLSKTLASKHLESRAADCAPYPIDYSNNTRALARFYYMQGIFRAVAYYENIKIRQGCDWDGDGLFSDQTFHDLPHIELGDSEM